MAYSRFSEHCDVYVFMHVGGFLQCCGCRLGDDWNFDSTDEMVEHVAEHRAAGHNVPDGLEQSLLEDDEDNFPPSCRDGHDPGEPYHPYPDGDGLLANLTRRNCTRCGWTL